MKEFFQEIAKQRGILLIIIGAILLIVGAASRIQIGQNSLFVKPAYQIIIMAIAGVLIVAGAILTIRENIATSESSKVQSRTAHNDHLKSMDFLYSQSAATKKDILNATQINILGYSVTK